MANGLAIVILFFVLINKSNAALDESACADLIVAEIQTLNPGVVPTRLKPFWQAICRGLFTHLKAQMEINLQLGDVKTPGPSGLISQLPGSPVTGIGLSSPGLIPGGRIQ